MSIPFSAMVTYDGTISFTHTDGRIYNILKSHSFHDKAMDMVRELSTNPDNEELRMELFDISQPKKLVAKSTNGRITVEGEEVLFDGNPVEPVVAKRLIWMLEQSFDAEPLFKFLTLLSENPSYRAVQCLYAFMDASKMAITHEGKILTYKRVTDDYKDIRTKTFDNSVGSVVEMPRNEVNEDPAQTCSNGLHVCSMSYLPHYGVGDGSRVVVCEVHPKDVVAVPRDYNNAKMRVCRYRVVGEVDDVSDILGSKAVITPKDYGWTDGEFDWGDDVGAEVEDQGTYGIFDYTYSNPVVEPEEDEDEIEVFDFTEWMAELRDEFNDAVSDNGDEDYDDADVMADIFTKKGFEEFIEDTGLEEYNLDRRVATMKDAFDAFVMEERSNQG